MAKMLKQDLIDALMEEVIDEEVKYDEEGLNKMTVPELEELYNAIKEEQVVTAEDIDKEFEEDEGKEIDPEKAVYIEGDLIVYESNDDNEEVYTVEKFFMNTSAESYSLPDTFGGVQIVGSGGVVKALSNPNKDIFKEV